MRRIASSLLQYLVNYSASLLQIEGVRRIRLKAFVLQFAAAGVHVFILFILILQQLTDYLFVYDRLSVDRYTN